MKTLLVGNTDINLSTAAKLLSDRAVLITQDNYLLMSDGINYTSLGDFTNLNNFVDTLSAADTLIYSPPDNAWSHEYIRTVTEFYIWYFYQRKKKIYGMESLLTAAQLDINKMLALSDLRQSNNPQIWNIGCSITFGIGVDKSERYGQLVADQLQMPISFLATGAASIEWAADQLIRSDIRPGDIVIWGLTSFNRFPYYDDTYIRNGGVRHVLPTHYDDNPRFNKIINRARLDDINQSYRAVQHIYKVLNFCKKLDVKLILAGILIDCKYINYTVGLPNYIQLCGQVGNSLDLDTGTDNIHCGPMTHRWYADQIITVIKELNYV